MIDARSLAANTDVDSDICIIGAGAAGITLAKEFSGGKLRVALLESGGFEFDARTQALYQGSLVGHRIQSLESSRLRFFGGATNHWAGTCRPLDALDFQARDWVPLSGWPFGRSELAPYYRRAHALCQLGPFDYQIEHFETEEDRRLDFAPNRLVTRLYQLSPPTRFGQQYRDEIVASENVRLFLHANVVDIESSATANHISRVRVACLDGNSFRVSARRFVLATGAIENARLLLASNRSQPAGLGNQHDLVGRNFLEHPHYHAGLLLLSDPRERIGFYERTSPHGHPVTATISLSPEALRRERLPNLDVIPVRTWPKPEEPAGFLERLERVVRDVDVGGFFEPDDPIRTLKLVIRVEQVPNLDSRVTLSDARDEFGMNRVQLDWQPGDVERSAAARVLQIFAEEAGRAGIGRVRIEPVEPAKGGSYHHMGTTRMHVDPRWGVVDANCRIHGLANLWVAGSSVFPTAGSANPTLTLVALAVRLADHLRAD